MECHHGSSPRGAVYKHSESFRYRAVQTFIKHKIIAFLRTAILTDPLVGTPVRLSAAQSCVARYTVQEVHSMFQNKHYVGPCTGSDGLWLLLQVCCARTAFESIAFITGTTPVFVI